MQTHEEHHDEGRLTKSPRSGSRTVQFTPSEAREAFLDFHQQEYLNVVAFLMITGAVRQDAEDAAQEAFLDAWRLANRPGGWETIDTPRGWIRKVALRKYNRLQKEGSLKRRIVTELTEIIPIDHTPDHGELTVQTEFVRAVIRELDPDTRIVMAYHIDGFRPAEIARQLSVDSQRIRDLIKKGRKDLKARLIALRGHNERQGK
jgi:RNA polymerase sigma factor (sigma-70 family)